MDDKGKNNFHYSTCPRNKRDGCSYNEGHFKTSTLIRGELTLSILHRIKIPAFKIRCCCGSVNDKRTCKDMGVFYTHFETPLDEEEDSILNKVTINYKGELRGIENDFDMEFPLKGVFK